MKSIFCILLFTSIFSPLVFGQEKSVKFTVEISPDKVLAGNYFEVKFTLENADGKNFEAPDFSEHFNVQSGPNFSSSFSMVNGDVTQSMTVTYYLEPRDIGSYYILPASIEAEGKVLETAPLEVVVAPNPDGIRQQPPKQRDPVQFRWNEPFDLDFSFPELPSRQSPPPPQPEETPKKKKRKTVRI